MTELPGQEPLPFSLDDPHTLTRRDHPETSHQAAAMVAPRTGTMRHTILVALAHSPATDEELWHRSGLRQDSARPRRVELVRQGYAEDTGDRRETESGAQAIVWRITAAGQQALSC